MEFIFIVTRCRGKETPFWICMGIRVRAFLGVSVRMVDFFGSVDLMSFKDAIAG